jgi:hypothetical protein
MVIYDHIRENFDRHAAYVVVAYVAGGRDRSARCGCTQTLTVDSPGRLLWGYGELMTPRPVRIGIQLAQYGAPWPALLAAARDAEAMGVDV